VSVNGRRGVVSVGRANPASTLIASSVLVEIFCSGCRDMVE